jgi:hypothetical protein
MPFCTDFTPRMLCALERCWSITNASAIMLSTVSVMQKSSLASTISNTSPHSTQACHAALIPGASALSGYACMLMDADCICFAALLLGSALPLFWGRFDVLISKLEHVVRTCDNTRAYSRHLAAASRKLWYILASTVATLFSRVSISITLS